MEDSQVKLEATSETDKQPVATKRRPWHAPQFMMSSISQANHAASPVATDGTPVSQLS